MEKNSFCLSLHDTSVLKGIAICAMLCHHLFYQSPESGYVVWHLAMLGKVCVSIFLLLSGYGLTIQMKKLVTNSASDIRGQILCFLLKRYTKFYLNYWAIFIIFVPIGVFCFDRPLTIPYGESGMCYGWSNGWNLRRSIYRIHFDVCGCYHDKGNALSIACSRLFGQAFHEYVYGTYIHLCLLLP